MRTLLHTCCGPCASACVPRLKEMDRDVTMLFANSNIDTREEFDKRFREAEKLAKADGVKLVALPHDHEEWLREVAVGYENEPEKGSRCARCFRYNLSKTAAYAAEHGFNEFTTSLTVSPHKDSKTIFSIAQDLGSLPTTNYQLPAFLPIDFKKHEGFKLSTKRAAELGLYRQSYCGCEFSKWRIHHKAETVSTNLDAREGRPGDVFTADFQTAGRGRLDHKWLSPPGTNLMMSVVLSVTDLPPEHVATLPLAIGLAVAKAVGVLSPRREPCQFPSTSTPARYASSPIPLLKWPNDVLVNGRKLAGILCERQGDNVIVGIGVNVNQTEFPPEIASRATSLALLASLPATNCQPPTTSRAMWSILKSIDEVSARWRTGFDAVYSEIAKIDFLKGRTLSVRQTDDDSASVTGVSDGIMPDGSLDVGGTRVYAGEAHVGLGR